MEKIFNNYIVDEIYKKLHHIKMNEVNNEFRYKLKLYERYDFFALVKMNKLYLKVNTGKCCIFGRRLGQYGMNEYFIYYNSVIRQYKRKLDKIKKIKNNLIFKIISPINI